MRNMIFCALFAAVCCCFSHVALAAEADLFPFPSKWSDPVLPDVKFPESESSLSFFTQPQMGLYKPEGAGPFPAVVLFPTCGGVSRHLLYWTKEAIKAGYVVLVLDHMSQRNFKDICGRRTELTFFQGAKDAMAALEYLSGFSFVDRSKIGLIGYSRGGAVAVYVSSTSIAEHPRIANKSRTRYAAVVGLYPVCYRPAWGADPRSR